MSRKKVEGMGPKEVTRNSKTFIPNVERVFHDGSILECLTHEGLFTPEECAGLIRDYGEDDSFFTDATVNAAHNSDKSKIVESIRKGKIQFLEADEHNVWVFEKLLALVTSANDTHYHFDLDHFDSVQISKYEVGAYYNEHIDLGPGRYGNRKLSLTLQLSESDAYEGGDLIMPDLGNFHASRAVGGVTVFPSFLKHRVSPITKGTRYSIVAWLGGKYRFK